jgi:hypothetical protein
VWTLDISGRLHRFEVARQAGQVITAPVKLAGIALGSAATAWAVGGSHNACQHTLSASAPPT